MGGRAQEPKLPEMGTPAPLRRRKEREFGRRGARGGALDDPGTGWSLLTKCDTSRVDVVANDCPGAVGQQRGGSDNLAADFLFGKVPEPVTDPRR